MSGSYLATRLQIEDDLRYDDRLTPIAFKVAIELVRRRHAETGQCNVSIPTLAEALSCGTRTIDRTLVALVDAGWIVKTTGKGRSSNTYVIPRLERGLTHRTAPGADDEALSRQNGATTDEPSRQNGATTKPLSRHFDHVVAPFCTSLSRQNGAQSLLGISFTDLTPIAPGPDAGPIDGGGGGASASPKEGSIIVEPSETDRLWATFVETYPPDILDPVEPARQHFRSLPPGDQEAAVRLLPRYLAEHAKRKRSGQHVGRLRWLKERRWEGLLRADAPRTVAGRDNGGKPTAAAPYPDPVLEFPGGFKRRESFVVAAIANWRKRPSSWPMTELGAPPGVPGCQVPRRLLQDPVPTRAREPAECAT